MEPRKRRRMIGRTILGLFGLAVVALIAYGFVPKPIPVVTGRVQKQDLEVTVDESGKTRIRSRYVVSAPVMGNLARITLKPGDEVKAGDIIAQISPMTPHLLDERTRSEALARVSMSEANVQRSKVTIKRAEAALNFARGEAARLRALHEHQGVTQQALEQAEFQLRAAEEDLASAEFAARVANHELAMARAAVQSVAGGGTDPRAITLLAPITGRVLRVYQESETVVQAGMPLIELGDPSALEIVVDVLSTDAVEIVPGAKARIERWGGEQTLSAHVRKKEPSAFTTRSALGVEEQRVPVVLDPDNQAEWSLLGDGYRVETRIQTKLVKDAVVAPGSAVFRDGPSWAVFAVRAGKAEKVKVELGARTPDWVEVKSGLAQGDTVILYPSDQVRDGIQVSSESERG